MRRNLVRVLCYMIDKVIPKDEVEVIASLRAICKLYAYKSPEEQYSGWAKACDSLDKFLGEPQGNPWKERVARIMADKEKVPVNYTMKEILI